jgi:zinc transporter, ZIP family
MIAIGIGLHNPGEGLAIGSAYAVGALAVGAALVVGFALRKAWPSSPLSPTDGRQ